MVYNNDQAGFFFKYLHVNRKVGNWCCQSKPKTSIFLFFFLFDRRFLIKNILFSLSMTT